MHPVKMTDLVDFTQPSLYIATASILFNPVFWNIVARLEFHHSTLTKLAFNNPYYGCYTLAFTIFSLGILRDHLYQVALSNQPTLDIFKYTEFKLLAIGCFTLGGTLVVSSMWALGITGTYLGDYFGILMNDKVESFPFNVTDNPMYYGSTLSFIGTALWYQSPVGLFLSVLVFIEYKIALLYEEPYTAAIYAARERIQTRSRSKSSTSYTFTAHELRKEAAAEVARQSGLRGKLNGTHEKKRSSSSSNSSKRKEL